MATYSVDRVEDPDARIDRIDPAYRLIIKALPAIDLTDLINGYKSCGQ